MKHYRAHLNLFSCSFSVVALTLLEIIIFSANAMCADVPLISLPTGKNENRNKTAASSAKKENAREAVVPEDMLQGVFYDLKQTRDGRPNKEFSTVSSNGEYISDNLAPTLKVVQSFVNGSWQKKYDINGRMNYSALNAYYSPTHRVWISSFYIGDTSSKTAPQMFGYPNDVKPNCWICIYSGYVVAPFSGKFRFVGFGDDFLVVRFNRSIVFDYGRISATLGAALGTEKRSTLTSTAVGNEKSQSSKNPIERVMPTINKGESGGTYYLKNKLVIRSPEYMNKNSDFGSGLANGSVIDVRQGEVVPIEFLVGDVGGEFNYVLFVERLDANGMALDQNKPLLLFRTSEDLPPSFTDSSAVAYDQNSPIWKVVDVNGRSFPSHDPSAAQKDTALKTPVKEKSSSGTSVSSQVESGSTESESNPNPTAKRGDVTTIVEDNEDTTTETVTITEENDDTIVQTTVVTETRNGKVVKKTTTTTTTSKEKPTSETDEESSSSDGTSTTKTSSLSETDSSSTKKITNPFGIVQRPVEDDE